MIDLHLHTTYSDGTNSVKEVLNEAEKLGLTLLSITDHNKVEAYLELKDDSVRKIFSGEIMTGIEITTTYKNEVVEVLGYGYEIDVMKELLDKNLLSFREKKLKDFELIKEQYRKIGVKFNEDNIIFNPLVESCRQSFLEEIKKYPENYKFFLEEKNMDSTVSFTRNEINNPRSRLYVDLSSLNPSLEVAIDMIHKAGGLAFLAHTFLYSSNVIDDLDVILDKYPLDGLECFYTTFTEEQSKYLQDVCRKRKLFMSGGSDCHGTNKKNHNLGVGAGNLHIDKNVVDDWVNNNEFLI